MFKQCILRPFRFRHCTSHEPNGFNSNQFDLNQFRMAYLIWFGSAVFSNLAQPGINAVGWL